MINLMKVRRRDIGFSNHVVVIPGQGDAHPSVHTSYHEVL